MTGHMEDELTVIKAQYVGSYPSERECPKGNMPEYAFIGRSNVGKSSLINMLTGKRDLARTSKIPGKTRSTNLFEIDDTWLIADLPGYGYAKISKAERKRWQQMIESYLMFRANLVTAFVPIVLRHPLQDIDPEFIHWLGFRQVPFAILYTKADKIKPNRIDAHLRQIRNVLSEDWEELPPQFITSSELRQGREQVLQYISECNANFDPE